MCQNKARCSRRIFGGCAEMYDVIIDIRQVTPEWLTKVLHQNGFLNQGIVSGVHHVLTKTLMLSVVSRLEVRYSPEKDASAPSGLFLKISRPDLPRAIASEINRKEVEFYRTIPGLMTDPPFIRCYDAAYSQETGQSHLLLDDLSETHFQTESPQLPSQTYCELAVDCLAQLHAYWWEHPRLGKDIGALFSEQEFTSFVREVDKNIIGFLDFLGDRITIERRQVYERILASSHQPWKHLTGARGLTVIHGDAHCWNFLYPRDMERHRARTFDWSLWHVDLGVRDLAFMMTLYWDRERRAMMERHLLRRYYDGLLALGVKNYGWDECFQDYRGSAIRNLNVPVVQWSQGRSPALWWANLEKAMHAYEDLRCSELLSA